ncbi:hypothetical protein BMS3Abin14_01562 [bacterium BMS3Abin14]|nr:hypothetical protein BMS3Abin14_01562 [bacterium BMS3Abin14]
MRGRTAKLQQRPLLSILLAGVIIAVFLLAGFHGIIPVDSEMTCHAAGVTLCATTICAVILIIPFLLTVLLLASSILYFTPTLKSELLFVFERPPEY